MKQKFGFKVLFIVFSFFPLTAISELSSNESVRSDLREIIKRDYQDLPYKVDEITDLVKARIFGVRGIEFTYLIKGNLTNSQISRMNKYFLKTNTELYCTNEMFSPFVAEFVEIKFVYIKEDGSVITKLRVSPNDC